MSKSPGNQKLLLVFLAQNHAVPFLVGFAALAQINSDVKHLSFNNADKLNAEDSFENAVHSERSSYTYSDYHPEQR